MQTGAPDSSTLHMTGAIPDTGTGTDTAPTPDLR